MKELLINMHVGIKPYDIWYTNAISNPPGEVEELAN
jgi:hypothetical protein